MIFISAGHHAKDPGAVANGYTESELAIRIRDRVIKHLQAMKVPFIQDKETETLGQYLARIKPGSGSVVLEFHLDAGTSQSTGTTAIVANDATQLSRSFARELAEVTAATLGVRNRGVWEERQTARGKLGLMREAGTVCLLEVCFITNEKDLAALLDPCRLDTLCLRYAEILKKYEDLIK